MLKPLGEWLIVGEQDMYMVSKNYPADYLSVTKEIRYLYIVKVQWTPT